MPEEPREPPLSRARARGDSEGGMAPNAPIPQPSYESLALRGQYLHAVIDQLADMAPQVIFGFVGDRQAGSSWLTSMSVTSLSVSCRKRGWRT